MQYKAPLAGIYKVSAEVIMQKPTGKTVLASNPKWRWWRFWESKQIEVPEMETKEHHQVHAYTNLEVGESYSLVVKKRVERVGATSD